MEHIFDYDDPCEIWTGRDGICGKLARFNYKGDRVCAEHYAELVSREAEQLVAG